MLVPSENRVEVRTSPTLARVHQFFAPSKPLLRRIELAVEALKHRLALAAGEFRDEAEFAQFAAARADAIRLTPPRLVVVDEPQSDLNTLYKELVGEDAPTALAAIAKPPLLPLQLAEAFGRLEAAGKVWRPGSIVVPTVRRKFDVSFAYQNAVMNFVRAESLVKRGRLESRLQRLGFNGRLIHRHPVDGAPSQLVVLSSDPKADPETEDRFGKTLDSLRNKRYLGMRGHELVSPPSREADRVSPVYRVDRRGVRRTPRRPGAGPCGPSSEGPKPPPPLPEAGAGRKPKLGPDDRLLLVLMYYRMYVTQVVLGGLFGVDAGTACRVIREIGLAWAGVFRIPERKVRLGADERAEAFVDATDRPTNRPARGPKRYDSGKKKRHTITHQVVVVRKKKRTGRGGPRKRDVRIAAVSEAAPGSTHDKKVYDRSRLELPAGVPGTGDTAYLGTRLEVPTRKPRGRPLTDRQKAGNRRVARRRVVVEHGIGKMKVWRIAADRYRNPRSRHTVIMKNVAGLHNRMFG